MIRSTLKQLSSCSLDVAFKRIAMKADGLNGLSNLVRYAVLLHSST